LIFKAVFDQTRENLGYLTGAGADPEQQKEFMEAVKRIDGVEDVHHIITDYAGPKLVVDMHINVDGAALTAFPEVDRAYVHVEPIGYV